jgi:hypothetical protein
MNPLILIGFDLLFSAVLILLVLYLAWGRLRIVLEAQGLTLGDTMAEQETDEVEGAEEREAVDTGESAAVGSMTYQAQRLRKQGLSVEEIASRLKSPRGEIEMILALSEMGKTGPTEAQGPVVPPPKRKITELFRF